MCWAKGYFSQQKRADKQIPNRAPTETEQNSNHCNSLQSPKVSIESNSTLKSWASKSGNPCGMHLKALWHMWQELHNPHPNSKVVAISLVTLQQVMPAGNLPHCRFVFCNCQVRFCTALRLFCRISTILFSLWCTIFITQCLWFQHMFMGTACYLLPKAVSHAAHPCDRQLVPFE